MPKLTMTLHDVYLAMREAGIPTSPMRISAGIASGAYPFGRVVCVGDTGRRTVEIFKVDFYAWLESKIPKNAEPLQMLTNGGSTIAKLSDRYGRTQ